MRRPYRLRRLRRHVSSPRHLILVFCCCGCWLEKSTKVSKQNENDGDRKFWISTWFEEKQHIHIVKPIHEYVFFLSIFYQVSADWWFGLVVWSFGNLAVSEKTCFFYLKKYIKKNSSWTDLVNIWIEGGAGRNKNSQTLSDLVNQN